MLNNILIINTGGTFNKNYKQNPGILEVSDSNIYIERILSDIYKTNNKPKIHGIIYKDSLDITKDDRKELVKLIKKSKFEKIIIIHGTDTMNKTALFLSKKINNKQIILTGSMQPHIISSIETTGNLMTAIGYMQNNMQNNIYISMNGNVKKHNKIKKNYEKSVFEILT